MVRMQDDENAKTGDFVRGAVERIRALGKRGGGGVGRIASPNRNSPSLAAATLSSNASNNSDQEESPPGMLTYLEMRRALLRLGYTWNRSLPPSCPQYYDDDSISIASGKSSNSRVSGASGKVIGGKRKKRDVVATDNQLVMLLSVLVEMEEKFRAENMDSGAEGKQPQSKKDKFYERGLYLPELIQAYKLIIGGMQSLQAMDKTGNGIDITSCGLEGQDLSERLRERTKGLLRSFGPNHQLSIDQSLPSPSRSKRDGLTSPKNAADISTKKQRLLNSPSQKARTKAITDAGLQAPRLQGENLRKLMHNKDSTLAKIVEEHESEISAMASSMEELKVQEMKTRSALAARRRRTRLALLAGASLILGAGVYWEHQRRMWVQRQIAQGREAERLKSAKEIEQLSAQRDGLKKKLDTLEGTARYQHSRLVELESSTNKTLAEIDALEQKWWSHQAEIGRCRSAIRELEGDLITTKFNVEELEEEQRWCSNRLKGRDAELNSLRYAKSGDADVVGAARELALATAAEEGASDTSVKKDKPVQLEMKFNQAVRNAMILRQVYSGAGGIAVSIVLRAIVPQAFAFLNFGGGLASKAATKAVVVAPKPKRMFSNLKWVDRVHAATVVVLVLRTAVLFFMP